MNKITRLIIIRNIIKLSHVSLHLFLFWFLFISHFVGSWLILHPVAGQFMALGGVIAYCVSMIVNILIDGKIRDGKNVSIQLNKLLELVEKEAIFYPERIRDYQALSRNINSGNFYLAKLMASQILSRQRNIADGIPAHFQTYNLAIEERLWCDDKDIAMISEYKTNIANGDYEAAEILAIKILSP